MAKRIVTKQEAAIIPKNMEPTPSRTVVAKAMFQRAQEEFKREYDAASTQIAALRGQLMAAAEADAKEYLSSERVTLVQSIQNNYNFSTNTNKGYLIALKPIPAGERVDKLQKQIVDLTNKLPQWNPKQIQLKIKEALDGEAEQIQHLLTDAKSLKAIDKLLESVRPKTPLAAPAPLEIGFEIV
jgi:hypothetical protein